MFSVWDINGQPAHHDWRRVNRVLGPTETQAYDEDLREPGQGGARPTPRRSPAVRAYQDVVEEDQKRKQRQPARTADQIMSTRVRTVSGDTTVMAAWDELKASGVRHLPVVNAQRRLVGMLSERDLLRVAGTPESHPLRPVQNEKISTVMRPRPFSAHPSTPIREIARVMVDERIGAMPIIDDELDLVGIVSRGDVLRTLVNRAPMDLWI
jgi:acetoin utilization protein AcuB